MIAWTLTRIREPIRSTKEILLWHSIWKCPKPRPTCCRCRLSSVPVSTRPSTMPPATNARSDGRGRDRTETAGSPCRRSTPNSPDQCHCLSNSSSRPVVKARSPCHPRIPGDVWPDAHCPAAGAGQQPGCAHAHAPGDVTGAPESTCPAAAGQWPEQIGPDAAGTQLVPGLFGWPAGSTAGNAARIADGGGQAPQTVPMPASWDNSGGAQLPSVTALTTPPVPMPSANPLMSGPIPQAISGQAQGGPNLVQQPFQQTRPQQAPQVQRSGSGQWGAPGSMSPYEFGQAMGGRNGQQLNPADINLADMARWLQYGPNSQVVEPPEARQQAMQMWIQALQGTGQVRNQTGDLGLRQLQALGLPGLPGSIGLAANAERRLTEQHLNVLDPRTQNTQALIAWLNNSTAQNRPVTPETMAAQMRLLGMANSPTTNQPPVVAINNLLNQDPTRAAVPQGGTGPQEMITMPDGFPWFGIQIPRHGPTATTTNRGQVAPIPEIQRTPETIWNGVSGNFGTGGLSGLSGDRVNSAISDYINEGLGTRGITPQELMRYAARSDRFGSARMDNWWNTWDMIGSQHPDALARARLRAAVNATNASRPEDQVGTQNPLMIPFTNSGMIGSARRLGRRRCSFCSEYVHPNRQHWEYRPSHSSQWAGGHTSTIIATIKVIRDEVANAWKMPSLTCQPTTGPGW